jgi:hypothetical protein
MTSTPTVNQLKRAIQISEQIADLEAELASILKGAAPESQQTLSGTDAPKRTRRKRRAMSAEAREKIAAAQRARWAKAKGRSTAGTKSSDNGTKQQSKARKGGITAAGRAKLAAMMKARWAARKKNAAR